MGATYFTALSAFLWICIFILIISLFKYYTLFGKHFSISILIFMVLACIIRITIPLEFPFTHTIELSGIYSVLFHCLYMKLFSFSIGVLKISVTPLLLFLAMSLCVSLCIALDEIHKSRGLYNFLSILPQTEDEYILSVFEDACVKVGVSKKIKVVVHDEVTSPIIIGRVKPIIAMPDINFSNTELKGIFAHELIHYKHNHIALKLTAYIIKVLLWWNPLAYLLSNDIDDILEFHADSKICYLVNKNEQLSYLNGIVKVLDSCKESQRLPGTAIGLAEKNGSSVMEQRFKMILEDSYKKKNGKKNAIAVGIICFLFICSYSFLVQPHLEPNYADYNDDAPIIPPDAYIIESDDTYTIYDSKGNAIIVCGMPIKEIDRHLEIRKNGGKYEAE